MKILCVSDHVDPLVYSPNVRERFGDVDLVLSAGDLPMEYLGFIASSLNKPVVFVFGNHNLKKLSLFRHGHVWDGRKPESTPFENYFGATYVGGKLRRINDLLIAGLGGSMYYNGGENQFTEFQMTLKVLRMVPRLLLNRILYGRYLDVLLTHAAPRGIHDRPDPCHLGFRCFRWFMRTFKPRYLLHGHIHLYDQNAPRVTRYYRTDVINVYDHYLLQYEGRL